MAFPSNESQNHRYVQSYEKVRRVSLVPLLEKSERHENIARGDDCTRNSGNFSTPEQPVTTVASIDKITTLVNLPAIDKLLPSHNFGMLDSLPLDEQETQRVAVVHASSRASQSESQDVGAQGYASHIRKLIKSSGIYALASFATPLVSLVLSPFLTHNLSRADYGALAVVNTAIALLAGFTQLGLGSAFFRSYNFDYESQTDRLGVLSTIVSLLLLISISITIIIMVTAPWLAIFLFNNLSFVSLIRIAAIVVFLQNLTVPGYSWLRAENRALLFATLSISNLLITLIATTFLIGVMHMGIAGSLIATSSGYALIVICTLPIILHRAGVLMRRDIAFGMLAFGLPNVGNFIAVWILQLSDRFLLERLGSLSQTASYSAAYGLGSLLNTIVLAPFQLAWPSVLFTIAKRNDASSIFRLVFRWYSFVLLFAAFGASLGSTYIFNVLYPSSYYSAASIIPIITVSSVFYGIYSFLTLGIGIRRKTWIAFILTTVSALVNIGLNLILIPHYGAMGAAVSTLVGYLLLAGMAFAVNQRIYPIPFEIVPLVIALLVGIALYIGNNLLLVDHRIFRELTLSFSALVLYGGCLACFAKVMNRSSANKKLTEDYIH